MATTAESVFAEASARFVYETDQQAWGREDYWASIKEMEKAAAAHGGVVLDDCDGFATWCVARLRAAGLPARYVFCQTEGGAYHCVCESDGQILDNRQTCVLPIHLIPYTWISISGFKPGEPWHEISAVK